MIQRICVAGKGQRKLWEVMNMYLRFVGAGAHCPFSIFAHPNAVASFFEFEILEEFNAVLILRIIFQTSLPSASKPVWERSGSRCTRDCVDRDGPGIGELHGEWFECFRIIGMLSDILDIFANVCVRQMDGKIGWCLVPRNLRQDSRKIPPTITISGKKKIKVTVPGEELISPHCSR